VCGPRCRLATACSLLPVGTEAGNLGVSALPLTDTATKRRIGDILLAHGFVSEEALADAAAEQERTSQPLGQILVQHGAITRLELASALAEQWSDPSASISLLPLPRPGRPSKPQPHDDAEYAARLQGAVADLARRVQPSQSLEDIDERVTELSQQIEATLARTQRIEASVAILAESLEGVTGGVEDAFVALQTGSAGLAVDLARIDQTVGELATRFAEPPPQDPVLSARLAELGAAVDALADRPVIDDTVRLRVEKLASRLETLVDGAALEDLRGALREVEERPSGDPEVEARVGRLEALAERPLADEEVRGRVEELASRLETLVDGAALEDLRGALRELEGRPSGDPALEARLGLVEALATAGVARAEFEGHEALLADLRATLIDLEARPVGSPEIDTRLERIETHLVETVASAADATAVDALTVRIEAAAGAQEGLVASIDALGARIEEVADREGRVDGVVSRLDGIEARLETETEAVAELRDAAAARPDPVVDGRIEELAQALDSVRTELSGIAVSPAFDSALTDQMDVLTTRVEQLAADRADHDSLAAKLEAVEARVASDLVTTDDLSQALDRALDELSPTAAQPDGRIEELAQALDSVRTELSGIAVPPAFDSALTDQMDVLTTRVEQLAADRADHDSLAAKLEAVEARRASDLDTIDVLARALDRIRHDLTSVTATQPNDAPEAADAVARLDERLRMLEALGARVDELAESIETAGPIESAPASDTLRHEIDVRIDDLSRMLDERLAAIGASASPRIEQPAGSEDELERVRMSIERVGLHLGEHDRALAELMRSRGVTERLDELAARIDEVAAAGTAGGPASGSGHSAGDPSGDMRALMRRVDDSETSSQADRDKLMSRLERMASSIDWRLQRLETDDTE